MMVVGPSELNYSRSPTFSCNGNVCVYINIRTCSVILSGRSITSVEGKQFYNWVLVPDSSVGALRKGGAAVGGE